MENRNRKTRASVSLKGSVMVYGAPRMGCVTLAGEAGEPVELVLAVQRARNLGASTVYVVGIGSALRACGLVKGERDWHSPGWLQSVNVTEIGKGLL